MNTQKVKSIPASLMNAGLIRPYMKVNCTTHHINPDMKTGKYYPFFISEGQHTRLMKADSASPSLSIN